MLMSAVLPPRVNCMPGAVRFTVIVQRSKPAGRLSFSLPSCCSPLRIFVSGASWSLLATPGRRFPAYGYGVGRFYIGITLDALIAHDGDFVDGDDRLVVGRWG